MMIELIKTNQIVLYYQRIYDALRTTSHVSCAMCHVLCVICNIYFFYKLSKLVCWGSVIKTGQTWQISARAEAAPCAHFQKLDVGINQFFLTQTCVFSLWLLGCSFLVKSNKKKFLKTQKNCKKLQTKKMVLHFLIQKKYLNVCRSSQICTGIVLLDLSSEVLFIQLQKIFCC